MTPSVNSQAQTLGGAPDDGISIIRVVLVLVLCLLLAGAGALALRHRLNPGSTPQVFGPAARRLVLVERLRLSPQHGISLVRCDDREFLIATCTGAASSITEITPGPALASEAASKEREA